MSLIPSESNSFADLLGRGLDGSKKSKWREPVTEPPKLPDPPKSLPRSSALKRKPQTEQPPGRTPKTPANRKVEAKKPPAISPKEESVPLPAPAAVHPVPPVIETELKEDILPLFIPEPIPVPLQELPALEPVVPLQPVELFQPVELSQPVEFSQPVQLSQPVEHQPVIKAPLVIQPEDEPPRRPIPIVRVARSKQDPHGDGRATMAETNDYDVSAPQPPFPEPVAAAVSPAAPRLRPKPLMRAPLEEEPHATQPLIRASRGEVVESPQHFEPTPQPAVAVEPNPEEDPWLSEESAWASEHLQQRRSHLVRCLTCEAVAILVLIIAVLAGSAHRLPDDPLNMITRILAIFAAVVAMMVPVLFYALPDGFPRGPR